VIYPPGGWKITKKEFFMKNVSRLFGIIVFVAVIGFSMTACPNDNDGGGSESDPALIGTWKDASGEVRYTFAEGGRAEYFSFASYGSDSDDATYSTSDGRLTITSFMGSGSADYLIAGTTLTISNPSTDDETLLIGVFTKSP
jgi:hypothetical protein